jgi:cytoskeletal protein RodZ
MSKQSNTPYPVQDATEITPGRQLKQLREQMGLTIKEVSSQTHISCSNITAIETAAFEQLPADTFVRGLVTLYGNFLGINGQKTAQRFLLQRDQVQAKGKRKRFFRCSSNALAPKKLAEPSHVSSATLAVILLLIIVFSFTSFCAYTGWNPFVFFMQETDPAIQPLSETIAKEPTKNTTSSALTHLFSSANAQTQKKTTPYKLKAVFTRDTGVDIIIDGKKNMHLQGTEGEQVLLEAGKSIRLFFDEPGSAKITVNETKVAFPTHKKDGKLTLTIPDELPNS